jgi:hypothetical protein
MGLQSVNVCAVARVAKVAAAAYEVKRILKMYGFSSIKVAVENRKYSSRKIDSKTSPLDSI